MTKSAILFGASREADLSYLEPLKKRCPGALVVCADGGVAAALSAGFSPDVVAGDMDSSASLPPGCEIIRFAPEKDDPDLKICAKIALSRGCRDFVIVAASGGRLDHYLANLYLLEYLFEQGADAELLDAKNCVFLHKGGKMTIRSDPSYRYFGLIPLDYTLSGVTLRGLKYPLNDALLKRPDVISVSNEFAGDEFSVEIQKGRALIIFSRE